MEPNSFTKTSFCNVTVDNITTNETKEYILNHLNILCSGIKFNKRYAKVYNDQYSKNLKNPHVFFLKSIGTPYLLFLTQINDTNYTFLIDKKTNDKYSYPKILIVPYNFSSELYKGTLLETELIRDYEQNWSLAINDAYYLCGENQNKNNVIDRINSVYKILDTKYSENHYSKICPLFVKRYFDYKDIKFVKEEFIPKLPYKIRGIYFVPMRIDYSNILYLFPKDSDKIKPIKNESIKNNTHVLKSKPIKSEEIKSDTKVFRIIKTLKTDVYELYLKDNENLVKKGVALIQSTNLSHKLYSIFENKSPTDEVKIECKYNNQFNKWVPINLTHKPVSENSDN